MPVHRKNPIASARKQPVQERSRRTVEAILQATTQVLIQRGYENATTGAIAERAGVSIGTLYQYFPNKELLVASLIEAHFKEVLTTIESALSDNVESPLAVLLRAVIRASLDAHRLQPALHKVLIEQVPRVGKFTEALELGEKLSAMLQQHLARHFGGVRGDRLRMIAFVLETTIEALTHRAVIESPRWLNSGELEAETFRLLAPYIKHAAKNRR